MGGMGVKELLIGPKVSSCEEQVCCTLQQPLPWLASTHPADGGQLSLLHIPKAITSETMAYFLLAYLLRTTQRSKTNYNGFNSVYLIQEEKF